MTPDEMRKRFHDLGKQREAIMVKVKPFQDERDKVRAQRDAFDAQLRTMHAKIKAESAGLYDIDMERGALARALNGKTGTAG